MPASPFGLAYGLGVAANAIPTQMNERANMDLQMQMRQLQLSQMQRQEAEQKAMQQAAMNVQPEMEQVTSPAPGMEETQKAYDMLGGGAPTQRVAAPNENEPIKALNLAPPTAPIERPNIPTVTRTQAKVYSTPYQAAAHRYSAMADYLFKQGMVEPAMRLQQQASQANQMHMEKTGEDAARLLGMGSKDAIPLLRSLGVNAADVGKDKDGTAWIKDDQGNYTPIDYGDLAALASDGKNLGAVFAKMNASDSRLYAQQYNAQKQLERVQEQNKSKEKIAAGNWGNQIEVQNLRNAGMSQAYGSGGKTPAKIAAWDRAVADTKNMHPDWDVDKVMAEAAKHPLVATAASLKKNDPAAAYRILLSKQMEGADDKSHPLHDLYVEAKAEIANAKKPTGTKTPAPKTEIPEGKLGIAKDGTPVIRRGGKWVER